ncbi:MAG: putative toxin-antitoxin system toxin component, PIN family [Chloroflexi bacterium]|nr:putative toxin-antitoxin system toxin component, PIN family [Chloroflexota bacterium]
MKVVPDTNTIISGIGWDGPPRRILMALREGIHRLVTSPDLLDELTRVLTYPKLKPLAAHPSLPVVLEWLHRPEHLVFPDQRLDVIAQDPADNRVLEAAVAGRADVIVSGDRHLLAHKEYEGIPILSARQFVAAHL